MTWAAALSTIATAFVEGMLSDSPSAGSCRVFVGHGHGTWSSSFSKKNDIALLLAVPLSAIGFCAPLLKKKNRWLVNDKAELCRLYLIGKAKSLGKQPWLWQPIVANPKPVLRKQKLKIAAKAFATFLR